ncbi:WecB/TagA/CpsF family glycosyltransferase [Desulfospira joergensenii]|uniref:WecB/TagA/CpsF family glycosyltransferase n=1 Tax=Desulfospira joergensenii TaxID=53329 RepID=UPI0013768C50|nr:WecB/TagA/CpsF family glycosyltransferase [Desulfospira joergensenii]
MPKSRTFPIKFDALDLEEVVSYCLQKGPYRYIVTPNVDHMCRLYKDSRMLKLYSDADLCVCDSKILQYISRIFMGTPVKKVVRGSDLVVHLLKSMPKNLKISIIGNSDQLKTEIKNLYGLSSVDVYTPPMGFSGQPEEIEKTLTQIIAAGADVIFLAVGSPRQEVLAIKLRDRIQHGVAICCGNAVNFAAGNVKRSPKWMSNIGLEWFHRILTEPERMVKRYIKNLEIFLWVFRNSKKIG